MNNRALSQALPNTKFTRYMPCWKVGLMGRLRFVPSNGTKVSLRGRRTATDGVKLHRALGQSSAATAYKKSDELRYPLRAACAESLLHYILHRRPWISQTDDKATAMTSRPVEL